MADTKISGMSAVSSVVGTHEFAVNEAGVNKKATGTQLAAFIAPPATNTVSGILQTATQADQEAGTDVTVAVTPGSQHFHPSAAKFWCYTNGAGTPVIGVSYNVTSIADTGTGLMTVTLANDFSSSQWCGVSTLLANGTGSFANNFPNGMAGKAAGSVVCYCVNSTALRDPTTGVGYQVVGFGDHAP
jgi:hypothetical protein